MTFSSNSLQLPDNGACLLLDPLIFQVHYCPIDLAIGNLELSHLNIQDPDECQKYITAVLLRNNAQVAYGGYLEKRNLYGDKSGFSSEGNLRNIHLGIDFWTSAGTKVIAPLEGQIHSFQNNKTIGDYGPTIILKHAYSGFIFHTLYGHLSLESLQNLEVGMSVQKGAVLGTLGTPDINVNYAPHLHFQIIEDMEGKEGDYPGVCTEAMRNFYTKNCPDPNILLQL